MQLDFIPRSELSAFEWDHESKHWQRPELDRDMLRELTTRSTWNGLWRIGVFVAMLAAAAVATVWASRYSPWLAILPLYAYYFLFGFWVAIGHELQHKIVFARPFDRGSEIIYFVVQFLMWNSPRYARVSHRLHHRYTMVQGIDPETDWPKVITTRWLRRYFWGRILAVLVVGSLWDLWQAVVLQIRRIAGHQDRMMRNHCSAADIKAIRIESAVFLALHVAIAATAIWWRRWEPVLFVTIAWQIGWAIEGMWHQTEHIGRCYDVNDQRLCTRSIRVGWLIRFLYWGLDDHVDHHMFPAVPSRNLPRLHALLKDDLAEPRNMIGNWKEMFAIAREKDEHPEHEFAAVPLVTTSCT